MSEIKFKLLEIQLEAELSLLKSDYDKRKRDLVQRYISQGLQIFATEMTKPIQEIAQDIKNLKETR